MSCPLSRRCTWISGSLVSSGHLEQQVLVRGANNASFNWSSGCSYSNSTSSPTTFAAAGADTAQVFNSWSTSSGASSACAWLADWLWLAGVRMDVEVNIADEFLCAALRVSTDSIQSTEGVTIAPGVLAAIVVACALSLLAFLGALGVGVWCYYFKAR